MIRSRLGPLVALAWMLFCVAGVFLYRALPELACFALIFAMLAAVCTRDFAIPRIALEITLPFALPLAVVHGILNPYYSASWHLFGWVPLRPDGFFYSLFISLRILILSTAAVAWRFVDADRLMREAVHAGLPRSVIVTLSVAIATMRVVPAKIKAVYLAQQARGMPSGPGLGARIRALPSVVIPVIVATLVDGSSRGTLMLNRGLGTTAFNMPLLVPLFTLKEVGQVILGLLTLFIPLLVKR